MKQIMIVLLLLLLVSCGGQEVVVVTATPEPATATLEPTLTHTPTPTLTATPEPTATDTPTLAPTPVPDVRTLDLEGVLVQPGDLPSRLRVSNLREDYTILYSTIDDFVDSTDPARIVSYPFYEKTSTTDDDQEGAVVVFLYDESSSAAAAYAQLTRVLFTDNPYHEPITITAIGQQSRAGEEVFFTRIIVQQCRAVVLVMMDHILNDSEDITEFAVAVADHLGQTVCW